MIDTIGVFNNPILIRWNPVGIRVMRKVTASPVTHTVIPFNIEWVKAEIEQMVYAVKFGATTS